MPHEKRFPVLPAFETDEFFVWSAVENLALAR
jgi:hypothetical protein